MFPNCCLIFFVIISWSIFFISDNFFFLIQQGLKGLLDFEFDSFLSSRALWACWILFLTVSANYSINILLLRQELSDCYETLLKQSLCHAVFGLYTAFGSVVVKSVNFGVLFLTSLCIKEILLSLSLGQAQVLIDAMY